jgi:hypothetical protein
LELVAAARRGPCRERHVARRRGAAASSAISSERLREPAQQDGSLQALNGSLQALKRIRKPAGQPRPICFHRGRAPSRHPNECANSVCLHSVRFRFDISANHRHFYAHHVSPAGTNPTTAAAHSGPAASRHDDPRCRPDDPRGLAGGRSRRAGRRRLCNSRLYYRAPELDAAAFDQSGGFLTGDLGAIDHDGRVRFRGRLKEMIKTGGINVAPLEVEEVLLHQRGTDNTVG